MSGTIAYRIENPVNASAATSSMLRLPHRSPSAPVIGADAAEEYVRNQEQAGFGIAAAKRRDGMAPSA